MADSVRLGVVGLSPIPWDLTARRRCGYNGVAVGHPRVAGRRHKTGLGSTDLVVDSTREQGIDWEEGLGREAL
jgi:hypothetical protein